MSQTRATSHAFNWTTSLATSEKEHQRQVSILSWNILAQYLFDSNRHWYQYVDTNAPVSWPERFALIMDEITSCQADIICLQEVEFEAFDDFLPSLKRHGYSGIMQNKKRRSGDHGHGVATFYREEKFELVDTIHRSRTMVTLLKDKERDNRTTAVVNCHLEGRPDKAIARVKQLQSTLQDLSTKYTHHAMIVCGDMNCMMNDSACSTYLQLGTCKDMQIMEWGSLVDSKVSDIPSHSYSLQSAYPVELMTEQPMDYVTFVSSPQRFVSGLDQIWYHDSSNSVTVKGIKNPFHSPEHRRNVLESGLPCMHWPSDHLAIGCILEWKKDADKTNLCHQELTCVTKDMNESDLRRDAIELLSACPFELEEQREEFLYVTSEVVRSCAKGKPTEEEIQQIRDRRTRKKKLMSEVSDEVQQILEQVAKLMKAAESKK